MTTPVLALTSRKVDDEGTAKYLWGLHDGRQIESVAFTHHASGLCLSTQTGCAVGCTFCATALQRPARNLSADEIVGQAAATDADRRALGAAAAWDFMTLSGMGEPMLNYDNVVEAGRRLYDEFGLDVVSVTSSGVVPRIRQLARADVYLQLHVSLHATDDQTRARLIPITRRWGIAEVLAAAREFAQVKQRRVIVNYLLFEGINDSRADADRLAGLLDPSDFEVHLLMWNDVPGMPFRRIDDAGVARFSAALAEAGLLNKPMPSKGRKIAAGCGQLLAETQRRKG
jgi:23S rRNA (adenine2503-C2)-methyltransferase